jgi:hypothetical protein
LAQDNSRRCFLKIAMASGGALCLGAPSARADLSEAETKALRDEMALTFANRQARDRMRLFTRLVKKYGDELVSDVETATIEDIRNRMQRPDIVDRGLEGVKAYLWDTLGHGFEFDVVEDTPTALEYRVTRCHLAEAVAEHGGTPELGHAFYCAWDLGFCQGLNPDIRFTRDQTLMQGDSCCNHRYEVIPKNGTPD